MHFTWRTSPQTPHTGTAAFDSILESSHNEGNLTPIPFEQRYNMTLVVFQQDMGKILHVKSI